jgi:UPF0755 protein
MYKHHLDQPSKRPKKANLKIFAVIAVIALLAFFGYQKIRYDYVIKTAVNLNDNTENSFIIKKGDSLNQIAINLLSKNLILDDGIFKSYLKDNNFDRKIIAGRFLLNRSMTIPQIAAKITDSKQSEFILTVPEGSTIIDIDKKLVELNVIRDGEFITATKNFSDFSKYSFLDKEKISQLPHPLEGYLFPDTYFIDPNNFKSEDLIQLMLNNFEKKIAGEIDHIQSRTLPDIITMASILEKEVRTDKDLPIVSGILWKRFDSNMQMGADATLLYLKEDRSLDYKDLSEDNPYNTRRHIGLPPGPISNPGLKTIKAAISPETSPYFYYLTKPGTGEVVYAVTNDEHNLNKAKYLN